jgi:cytoskeletal protein CcmA (bactofilin family)
MPIWKEQSAALKDTPVATQDPAVKKENESRSESRVDHSPVTSVPPAVASVPHRTPDRVPKESLIAEELTIEGKIEGTGHVRIAGRFKGDVSVKGNLAIEAGATLTGGVRANTVTIGGQLEGNIEGATRVELLETGILNGDLSADSLTVAAGSRMRGKVEFGWDKKPETVTNRERDRQREPKSVPVPVREDVPA